LPGSSHEKPTRPSGAHLLLFRAVRLPVVVVTAEGAFPVAIVVVIAVIVIVIVVIVSISSARLAMQ
jgi:hypothetical protein